MDDKYIFTYPTPSLGFWLKIRSRVAGNRDKKGVLEQFLKENNVNPRDPVGYVITRRKYMLKTHYVEYLSDLRDQLTHRKLIQAHKANKIVLNGIKSSSVILAKEGDLLTELRKQLDNVKQVLKSTALTSLERAHHQGDQGTLEASIKNQQSSVSRWTNIVNDQKEAIKINAKTHDQLLKDCHSKYDEALNEYITRAGRLLHRVGCTSYDAELRDYSDDIKKQIEELKNAI